MDRRKVLAGMGGVAAGLATPAWAQFPGAIKPQSDPYAQVDPYDDPRNGFSNGRATAPQGSAPQQGGGGTFAFSGNAPPFPVSYPLEGFQMALGEQSLAENLTDMGGLFPNREAQKALAAFADPFLSIAHRSKLNWQLGIVNEAGINACAAPGGKMFFNPELIAVCDHPAELASVIAHEIGHVDYDHHGKKLQLAQMVDQALKSHGKALNPELIKAGYGGSPSLALMRGWGLDNEFEADANIHTHFAKLGLDHAKASLFFHKLLKIEPPERETSLFSTHPGSRERIRRLDESANFYAPVRSEFTPPGWQTLKSIFPTPPEFRNG